ncbi:phosphotransferase family protein [Kribbella sp. NBC_00889]|uniref:phosphotransferase family protein n=1 Tax=Kribbella sp. NBC_00889 TaxID=2975974 RepID=UPI0038682B59|nr:aminoglycoside phosphotransferase [Kribbella sp. NBC_00889]
MSGAPDVDYTATSLRPDWNTLPDALREALTVALGSEIAEAGRSVSSGFTGGFAAPLRLADGRRVFVKASADTMHAYRAYQREAEVVPQLPAAIRVPAIVTTARSADGDSNWFAVVSEWVDARMPGVPWSAADFDVVTATCEAISDAMDPSPLDGLKSLLSDLEEGAPLQTPDRIIAGELPMPTGLQPWAPRILPELVDLIRLAPEAFAGDTATHSDLRPDNVLIDGDGVCWIVDWNWLALGPRWMDWIGLLPGAQHHGIDTLAAVHRSPLTADVPGDHLDSYIAAVAAYMMKNIDLPPPPGCTPALREHQRYYAWTFLDWLAARRGW